MILLFWLFLKQFSAAASGWATRNLGVQLTLLQPGGADYAQRITASPPGFENPAASLQFV